MSGDTLPGRVCAGPAPTEAERDQHTRILHVLDRLLYDADFRSTFLAGGPGAEGLRLADDLLPVFGRVDRYELALVGRRIRSGVLAGGAGSGLGLQRTFPRTLALLQQRTGFTVNRVAEVFIASPQFQEFRDVPFSPRGRGLLLPECFHRHLAARPALDVEGHLEPLAHHEAAVAVFRAVATGADATFRTELPGLDRYADVYCLFRDYAEAPPEWGLRPMLHLAQPGRCVSGPAGRATFDAVTAVLTGRAADLAPVRAERVRQRLRDWGMR